MKCPVSLTLLCDKNGSDYTKKKNGSRNTNPANLISSFKFTLLFSNGIHSFTSVKAAWKEKISCFRQKKCSNVITEE